MGKIRKWDPATKAKIALIALKGEQTYNEIASTHGVHPKMIQEWRKHLLDGASTLFVGKLSKFDRERDGLMDELYKQIGQLKVELDWLKKKSAQLNFR
jgi:transposase-like protein